MGVSSWNAGKQNRLPSGKRFGKLATLYLCNRQSTTLSEYERRCIAGENQRSHTGIGRWSGYR